MKLKTGDLVYLKNVGFPYNRTDDGHESFEGASGTVTSVSAGARKDMVNVKFLIPIKCGHGHSPMAECLFFPHCVVKETRPWLKKYLKQILAFRKQMQAVGEMCQKMAE